MPLPPSNSTHPPSGLDEHDARPGLAPIAQAPVFMTEEDPGNSPSRPSFTSPQHRAPAGPIRPPPQPHELHVEVMTQELLTWNSLAQDDLPLRNGAVIGPLAPARPAGPSLEPLDTFPRHSTELREMVRAGVPDVAPPSVAPISPPPLMRQSPYVEYQNALRTPCASVLSHLSLGQLASSDGDWGALSIPLSLALNSATFLDLDEASNPDRTPMQAQDALPREIPAMEVPHLLTAQDQAGPVDPQCQDDADSPLELTGLNSPHSSAHCQ